MLEVTDLEVALAGRTVLDQVTTGVGAGQLCGLVGPNGAGKTTLLRTVLGLVRARSGDVKVAGGRPRRHHIGYVPQRHEFTWEFPITVERVVLSGLTGRLRLGRRPGVAAWRAAHDALDRVELADLATRPVGQLSGGQRQRVLVARALALDPPLLLLDEPCTGLDLPTQDLLVELFATLAHEGRAVLMSTHDLVGAIQTCDRLVLLNRTVVADAPPAELRDEAVWTEAFGVSAGSPLLKLLAVL